MGIIKSKDQRIQETERENKRLRAMLFEADARLEYVAMMADVELPEEEEQEGENENV